MSNIWFTSDNHFGHANILKYCNRPFDNVEQMNNKMMQNWNSVVMPNDTIYCLGDFTFKDHKTYLDRLNGTKILICGNHDKGVRDDAGWVEVHGTPNDAVIKKVVIEKQKIFLCHYAMRVWNTSHHGAWQLYGHSHGSLPDDPNALSIDVGVDCHNYFPISFGDIKRIMKKKTFKPIDHHGNKDTKLKKED